MDLKPGYQRTDAGVIPTDWQMCRVGTKGEVRAGKALASRASGDHRPYLRTKNVFDGRIDISDVLSMPMTDGEFATYRLHRGDVLLNEGQSLELVGRCAMYRDEYPAPCAIQNQLIRFRAGDGTSAEFASHLFRHAQSTGVFTRIALQTTSVAHLGVSRFKALELPWPAEAKEQQAIAEVLSDADTLIESLEQLLAKKRQVKQGAMQELLTARRRLPGFSGDWREESLGELGRWTGGMTPSMRRADYWNPAEIPWISSGDVKSTKLTRTGFSVSRRAVQEGATTLVPANALVLVVRSGILRKYLPVAMTTVQMAVNQDIKALLPRPSVKAEFLLKCLMFNGSAILARCLKSGTTVESIEFGWLKDFRISLPPYSEQIAIAEVLSHMDREIENVEAEIGKVRKMKEGMMQQLLTGRIRLVDAEPAEDLQLVHSA